MSAGRRLLRWIALGAALPAVVACTARVLEAPDPIPSPTLGRPRFRPTLNRQIDILFMIDDSSSMEGAQANLRANMASFMDVLKGLPGGLPDLHIAIVTSDLGAGDGQSIMGCSLGGDGGVFRYAPTGSCTATGLDPYATFIIDSGGTNPQTNFGTEDITKVFQCMTGVGATGCGFEHQLASVARALGADGRPPPPENAGFLRPDAYLLIVLVTNEDDCSAPPGSPLFDPTSASLDSSYGPTENFLCNEWGHLCAQGGGALARPSRLAPTGSASDLVTYSPAGGPDNCVPSEDQALLTPVRDIADGIKALKSDPANQIIVAAIAGPTTPYTVGWRPSPTGTGGPWPEVRHSCGSETAPSGFADPAVRIQAFVAEFGRNGLVDSFCQDSYAAALSAIATPIVDILVDPGCIAGTVATKPGSTTADCSVVDRAPNPNDPSNPLSMVIPACADVGGQTPCWDLAFGGAGQSCPPGTEFVDVTRGGVAPPANVVTEVACAMCVSGTPDPSRHCP
jgi:hypothetical protein